MRILKVLVLVLVLAWAGAAHAVQTYYFDQTNGSDSNAPCTNITLPCQTLAEAGNIAPNPGDTIALHDDRVWREQFTIHNGGAAGNPVIITDYGNGVDKPLIEGSQNLTGWTLSSGSIWVISQSTQVHRVYEADTADATRVVPGFGLIEACAITGGTVLGECQVANMQAGSFFMDNTNHFLYVWLPDSGNPNNHTMEGSTIQFGITAQYNDSPACKMCYITIQNIQIRFQSKAAIFMDSWENPGCANNGGLLGITINNIVASNTSTGIVDAGYDNQISIEDDASCPGRSNDIIENSKASWCGGHNCIQVHGVSDVSVINNEASHGNHNLIDGKEGVNMYFANNYAHDMTNGGSCYYMESRNTRKNATATWANNICYNSQNGFQCGGTVFSTSLPTTCNAYNNTMYSPTRGLGQACFVSGGTNPSPASVTFNLYNNLCFNTDGGMSNTSSTNQTLNLHCTDYFPSPSAGWKWNGKFITTLAAWQATGTNFDKDSFIGDPKFATTTPTFTLGAGSAALDAVPQQCMVGFGYNIGAAQNGYQTGKRRR